MKMLRFKQLFLVSSLAGIALAMGGRSAGAETVQSPTASETASETAPAVINAETVPPIEPSAASADQLQTPAIDSSTTTQSSPNVSETPIAQAVDPGRATRSGSSYVGLGGNIGFGGETGLGTGNFAIISKVGLTPNLSIRPSALVGDGATFVLPATVDFPIATRVDGRVGLAPFIGGGVAISTGDDSEVQPLVTAGVDIPISSQFTANATANVSFPDDVEVGVILGIGYNFR